MSSNESQFKVRCQVFMIFNLLDGKPWLIGIDGWAGTNEQSQRDYVNALSPTNFWSKCL